MKNHKPLLFIAILSFGAIGYLFSSSSFFPPNSNGEYQLEHRTASSSVSFKLRGNWIGLVKIGVGPKVGSGACCRGVSKESTVSFQGKVGDVVWDSKTKRILIELTASSNGATYDLRRYY